MFHVKPIHWTLICAVVRHVDKLPRGTDRTAAAVYYLRCVARELQADNKYTAAYETNALAARIETDGMVNPVWKELRAEFAQGSTSIPSQRTPDCNTGVTPSYQAAIEVFLANK